jgi:pSer/pThr/pTyr-binding forkhead associated (FHA) protein
VKDATVSIKLPSESTTEKKIDLSDFKPKGPALVIVKGNNIGNCYHLHEGRITLGRDPESSIFLDDITVSRKHAYLSVEKGKVTISDRESLNGTYVNKSRIDSLTLQDGDEVQIGKFKMIYLAEKKTGEENGGE